MTTSQGIAVVTRTLWYMLGTVVRRAVPEANVTLERPEEPAAAAAKEPRLNIYLVQVAPDPTLRSSDLPTRNENGTLVSVPKAPVLLRYLLTFFGGSEKAHLMLGATELALRETAVLEPEMIRHAVEHHPDLKGAGLDLQVPPPRVVPSTVTLEELARFWSGFLQMPYTISTVYEAGPVILTAPLSPQAPLPVRKVKGPATQMPARMNPLPTVQFTTKPPGTVVPVTGAHLRPGQHVRVAGHSLPLAYHGTGVAFTLPSDAKVRPGPQPVTLDHGAPQTLNLRPELQSITRRRGDAIVKFAPPIHAGQQATLSLVDTRGPTSTQLTQTATATSGTLGFPLPQDLPDGRYLALLDVDGVSSLPIYERGRYRGPTLALTRRP